MRRRVTTADYYRYYRIPTHLAPSRSISSHAILLVLHSVDASLSVILRAIESWQNAIVDIDFHVKEMLERTSFRRQRHDECRRNFCEFSRVRTMWTEDVIIANLRTFLLKRAKSIR